MKNDPLSQELIGQAIAMLKMAYVPYSNYPVGAALFDVSAADDEGGGED